MATARQTRPVLRRYGQEKYQNQRGEEKSAEGQGRTYPAGSAELTFLPDPPARRRTVYMSCRCCTQKQQTQESSEGNQTSPRGSMLRLVHEAEKQT